MQCRLCTTAMPPTLDLSVYSPNHCEFVWNYKPPLPSSNGMASELGPSLSASESGSRLENAGYQFSLCSLQR